MKLSIFFSENITSDFRYFLVSLHTISFSNICTQQHCKMSTDLIQSSSIEASYLKIILIKMKRLMQVSVLECVICTPMSLGCVLGSILLRLAVDILMSYFIHQCLKISYRKNLITFLSSFRLLLNFDKGCALSFITMRSFFLFSCNIRLELFLKQAESLSTSASHYHPSLNGMYFWIV